MKGWALLLGLQVSEHWFEGTRRWIGLGMWLMLQPDVLRHNEKPHLLGN
jgi:hypothetical protein